MTRNTVIIIILALLLQTVHLDLVAQNRDYAVGVRLGMSVGGTFQKYLTDEAVGEFIMTSRYRGMTFTVLYEIHKESFDIDGLHWYFGGGAHLSVYPYYAGHPFFDDQAPHSATFVGVDGIIGIEYFIPGYPFQVSLDYKPSFNFHPLYPFEADGVGLSGRYTF